MMQTMQATEDLLKKEILLSYTKAKSLVNRAQPDTSNASKDTLNDTLLKQIDAVALGPSTNDTSKIPKDVVANMANEVDTLEIDADTDDSPGDAANDISTLTRDTERNILTNYANRNTLGNNADRNVLADEGDDNTWAKDGDLRSMAAKDGDDGGVKNMDYFFENNRNSLTNEDEDYDKKTDLDSVFAKKDYDNNNNKNEREPLLEKQESDVSQDRDNTHIKHKVSFSEKGKLPSDESVEYGTLFIKDNKVSKQINLYNSDIHLGNHSEFFKRSFKCDESNCKSVERARRDGICGGYRRNSNKNTI